MRKANCAQRSATVPALQTWSNLPQPHTRLLLQTHILIYPFSSFFPCNQISTVLTTFHETHTGTQFYELLNWKKRVTREEGMTGGMRKIMLNTLEMRRRLAGNSFFALCAKPGLLIHRVCCF